MEKEVYVKGLLDELAELRAKYVKEQTIENYKEFEDKFLNFFDYLRMSMELADISHLSQDKKRQEKLIYLGVFFHFLRNVKLDVMSPTIAAVGLGLGGFYMILNPLILCTFGLDGIIGILEHEAMHVLSNHFGQMDHYSNKYPKLKHPAFNRATDVICNRVAFGDGFPMHISGNREGSLFDGIDKVYYDGAEHEHYEGYLEIENERVKESAKNT